VDKILAILCRVANKILAILCSVVNKILAILCKVANKIKILPISVSATKVEHYTIASYH